MNFPYFISDNKDINTAYRLAIATLSSNILPFKDGILEKEEPVIIAGLGYETPWTRDAAINTWNAGGMICPEVSLNTLKSVLTTCENGYRIDGEYWDAIIWTTGAWNQYLYTGDKDDLAEPNTWLNATKLSSKFKTAELRKWYQESALGSPYQPNKENQLGTSSYFHVENMTDWHTYGLDWREDSITWYIDGIATMRLEIPEGGLKVKDSQQKERTYKFDQPMRLILGLAVDSSDTTPWSKVEDAAYDSVNSGVSMEIDYVRVYQDSKGEVYKNYERTK